MSVYVTVTVSINNEEINISEKEGLATLEAVDFFNNLFDSVNEDNKNDNSNELRCPVTENSKHHAFWVSAKNKLYNMTYVEKMSRVIIKSVPSLKNWLFTVNGFEKLWKVLHDQYNFHKLNTRYCNQDPLENFFGQIRSHAVRNVNPTPKQFEESFLTLIVNNMKSVSLTRGNCEISDSSLLSTLEKYLEDKHNICNTFNNEESELISDINVPDDFIIASSLDNREEIIRLILKEINFCTECDNYLRTSKFPVFMRQIICLVNKLLRTRGHQRNILRIILNFFETWTLDINWHECIEHHNDIAKITVRIIALKTIIWWCDKKNKLLNNFNIEIIQRDVLNDILESRRMRINYKNKRKYVFKKSKDFVTKKQRIK